MTARQLLATWLHPVRHGMTLGAALLTWLLHLAGRRKKAPEKGAERGADCLYCDRMTTEVITPKNGPGPAQRLHAGGAR
ncbi:hypothetical protein PV390_06910 [Streptomyces sp. ME02-6991-2A]|uniref:hypothetical protein n=1 Tax=Streptomyces sp. ME02-6991-2A TaxID=3028677 RepID=UPI00100836FB|nr:hypothetical protein [Streptomyces sp. ME02-6991-2A]MDX3374136.1 hypothetical protein [Streptomyces sp. ME02-6991-2A]